METAYHPAPSVCPVCHEGRTFAFKENYEENSRWSLYECGACRVQFWLPLVVPQGTTYEEEVAYSGKEEALNKENARAMVEGYWNARQFLKGPLSRDTEGKKLLDVGCGTGEFLFAARELGYDVEGIDFNKHAIAFARERLGLETAKVADLYEILKTKKEQYDVVTVFEVIEHVADPGLLIEQARAALKPGGYLVVSTPNRDRYWKSIDRETDSWDFPYQHLLRWTAASLRDFVERFGFDTVVLAEELPTDWFVVKLRMIAERLVKRSSASDQRTASERVRGGMGFSRYQRMKAVATAVCAVPAWFMFHIARYKGVHLYGVFQKKS